MTSADARTPRTAIAVVALTRRGAALAAELTASLGPSAELHVAERWASVVGPPYTPFRPPLGDHLAMLFPRVQGVVVVLALGATVRLIAPLLSTKHEDPAVVVVDEAGRHAISVVGGHGAGANELAERIAENIGAAPILTTASDATGSPAIDLIGKDHGWTIEAPPATVTLVSAAAVNGEPIAVYQDGGEPLDRLTPAGWDRVASLDELSEHGGPALVITDRLIDPRWTPFLDRWVVYRPRTLVVGIGCSSGVATDEVIDLIRSTLTQASLASASVAALATIDRRREEPALRLLASGTGLPLRTFLASELAAVQSMPTPSADVARHVGTPGVCEPAAVLASEGGQLVVSKRKSAMATVAVARRPAAIPPTRGTLAVVGVGPGSPDLMTPQARRALRRADAVVGYRGYLEPLSALLVGKTLHPYALGQEVHRCRAAIQLARDGHHVALVSSGDAGIYGMAGLVLELLDDLSPAQLREAEGVDRPSPPPGFQDVSPLAPPVEIVPGVTAANAAAALLGAPLMLDFAVISLSDLLVPWDAIERRLTAAALGDFVVVLYNPASSRRRHQLHRAAAILLEQRDQTTPVGLVRDAYRPDQSARIIELGHLATSDVDMKTIVIVGNSSTVRLGERLVTRRGYAERKAADE